MTKMPYRLFLALDLKKKSGIFDLCLTGVVVQHLQKSFSVKYRPQIMLRKKCETI